MSELHSWARALGGDVTGGEILCPGPGHTAGDRSLSVKIGRDGGPICYSHCGDDPILCKDFVREKIGLKPFKPNGHAKASSAKRHFDYHDEAAALVYQVEREDLPDGNKKIRQRRPDEKGGWVWNVAGVTPVPYRLPELLEALAHGRTIVIAEGEAKVDLLWSWNIPATCNSGGAGKWKEHHSAYLRGADVVILPDSDGPGHEHAETVAASLRKVGAGVRVLDLPGLPPKGDVIDWAAAGGTVEQLHALIERDARPCEAATASKGKGEAPTKPSRVIGAGTFMQSYAPISYTLGGILPSGYLYGLTAKQGSGKTALKIAATLAVAMNRRDILGLEVESGRVAYISALRP
jgi:hypothetical protein